MSHHPLSAIARLEDDNCQTEGDQPHRSLTHHLHSVAISSSPQLPPPSLRVTIPAGCFPHIVDQIFEESTVSVQRKFSGLSKYWMLKHDAKNGTHLELQRNSSCGVWIKRRCGFVPVRRPGPGFWLSGSEEPTLKTMRLRVRATASRSIRGRTIADFLVQPTPNEKKILRTQLFPSSPHTIRLRGYARSIGTSWSWISALKCVIFGFNGLSRSAAPLVLSPTVNKVVFNLNLITDMEKRSLPPLLSSRRRASARTLVYIFPAMGRQFLPKLEHLARAIVGPGRDSDFPAWRERYIIVNFPRIVEYSIMHSLSRLPPRTAQARFIAMVQRIGGQQSPPVIRAAKGEDSFAEDTSSRTWTDLRIQFLTVGEYRATLLAGEWEEETVGRW